MYVKSFSPDKISNKIGGETKKKPFEPILRSRPTAVMTMSPVLLLNRVLVGLLEKKISSNDRKVFEIIL